jgi:hypothetical protein
MKSILALILLASAAQADIGLISVAEAKKLIGRTGENGVSVQLLDNISCFKSLLELRVSCPPSSLLAPSWRNRWREH